MSRTWGERAREALVDVLGRDRGPSRLVGGRSVGTRRLRGAVRPSAAVGDLIHVEAMLSGHDEVSTSFGRSIDAADGSWRFRVFLRDRAATIAELVPILEHLGLPPVDERPYVFAGEHTTVHLDDIGVVMDRPTMSDDQHAEVQRAFVGLMQGDVEADALNRLVLAGGLDRRQIAVLRTYNRYLRQATFPFSAVYAAAAIVRHPEIARGLAEVFDAKFDPRLGLDADCSERSVSRSSGTRARATRRDSVTRRRPDLSGIPDARSMPPTGRMPFCGRDEMSVKLRPHAIPFLPTPAARVRDLRVLAEGRGRPSARWTHRPWRASLERPSGGLPHRGARSGEGADGEERRHRADRSEGRLRRSRGRPPTRPIATRCAPRASIATAGSCGRCSISPTTSSATEVVHPPDIVIYDGDDPYLVVAADKGTATFSDIANDIAIEHDFWLGDAFASGGSHGYDHKAMGITARGAWESVRRHARVIGKDVDTRRTDGRRHRRHVGRCVRQRDAAVVAHQVGCGVRPSSRLHRPRSRPGDGLRRTASTVRAASVELGRLRRRVDLASEVACTPAQLKSIPISDELRSGARPRLTRSPRCAPTS